MTPDTNTPENSLPLSASIHSFNLPKILLIILLQVVVITSSIFLGIYIGRNQVRSNTPQPITVQDPVPIETVSSSSPSGDIPTTRGYTFSYPTDWIEEPGTNPANLYLASPDGTMGFSVETSLGEYGTECLAPSDQTVNLIFGGKPKTVEVNQGFTDEHCQNPDFRQLWFGEKHGNDHYVYTFYYQVQSEKKALEILNQITSSFSYSD